MKWTFFFIAIILLAPLAVAFNPQPEPPGKARKYVSPQETKGFNPQPEPPGKSMQQGYVSPAQQKGFNPQPEPPGRWMRNIGSKTQEQRPSQNSAYRRQGVRQLQRGAEKGFNPQPEPPGKAHKYVSPQETKGFNPQPEPPGKRAQYSQATQQR